MVEIKKVDPTTLVNAKPRADKVSLFNNFRSKGKKPPPIVVFDDKGTLYVAEGANRTETAKIRGEKIDAIITDNPDYLIGKTPIWLIVIARFFGLK